MNPVRHLPAALGLFLALTTGCSRSSSISAASAQSTGTDPVAAARMAARKELFGDEALAKDIQWEEDGFGYRIVKEGTAPKPTLGTVVRVNYTGRLKDGTVFDHPAKPADFSIGRTITGLSLGLQMLGTGGKAVLFVPPSLGYGPRAVAGIPPNSGLIFDVDVVAVNP